MNVENKVDAILNRDIDSKIKVDPIYQDIILKPEKDPDHTMPWYYKFLIGFMVFLGVLIIVFYIITPTEAFTYYMMKGLTGLAEMIFYFIKVFGIAVLAIIITLGLKPLIPEIIFDVKHMDRPEKYYWRPKSYDVFDDLVQIETWNHDILQFNVSNMKKIGNKIYLVMQVIKTEQSNGRILLDSEELEVYKSIVDKKKIEFLSEKLADSLTMKRDIGFHQARTAIYNDLKALESGR